MMDWLSSYTPDEIKALEASLDAIFAEIEQSKDNVEAEDYWPGFMMPAFDRIEDKALRAEGAVLEVKLLTQKLITLVHELTWQRDEAIDANLRGVPLVEQLPNGDVEIVNWLISTLNSQKGQHRGRTVRRLVSDLAKIKQRLEKLD